MQVADLCSLCGGFLTRLGIIGLLLWRRCEDCGMDFSEPVQSEEPLEREVF